MADRVKVGAEIVKMRVADAVWLPEVPVMVTLYCPTAAELLAVRIRELLYVVVLGFGKKDAVTPLGRPDAEKVTLPVNPFRDCIEK